MDENKNLLDRATRTLGGWTLEALREQYRAIVGPSSDRDVIVERALQKVRAGQQLASEDLAALEEAIRLFRPALTSRRGVLDPLPPEAVGAFAEWPPFAARFKDLAYAVGLIDMPRDWSGSRVPVGTGFLVRPNVLATAAHVVGALDRGTGTIVPGEPLVWFGREWQTVPDRPPVRVLRILSEHPACDVALLELDATVVGERPVLELSADAVKSGESLVVVGYPCEQSARNPMFAKRVFQGDLGVKRAAPGMALKILPTEFHHDASTLGGSSGSPVLSLATGKVRGVHSAGYFLERNIAVAASELARLIADTVG